MSRIFQKVSAVVDIHVMCVLIDFFVTSVVIFQSCKFSSPTVSVSGGLRLPDPYRAFAPGPHRGLPTPEPCTIAPPNETSWLDRGIDKQCVWKFAVSSHTDQVRRPCQTANAFLSSSAHTPRQRCTIRHGSNYSRSSAGPGYRPSRRHRKSLLRSVECFFYLDDSSADIFPSEMSHVSD